MPPVATRLPLDVHEILSLGRTLRGIVIGDAMPQTFLPELVSRGEQGRLPLEKLVRILAGDRRGAGGGLVRPRRVGTEDDTDRNAVFVADGELPRFVAWEAIPEMEDRMKTGRGRRRRPDPASSSGRPSTRRRRPIAIS